MQSTVVDEQAALDALDVLVGFLLIIPSALWSVFVAWKLWGWFAVEAGLPALSYGAIGVAYVMYGVVTAKPKLSKKKGEQNESLTKIMAVMFAQRLVALGFGYVFHTWGA